METRWIVLCFLLSVPGLMIVALVAIQLQNLRIRAWKETTGRIVRSKITAQTIRKEQFHAVIKQHISSDFVTDETLQTQNTIDLAYEFTVGGVTYRGTRVDLGADTASYDVTGTLARYPEGKSVTVFYDPNHPDQCILEKDNPKNLRAAWFGALVMIALCIGGVLGVDRATDFIRQLVDDPVRAPFIAGLGLFAVALAVFAHMTGRAKREMRTWPKAPGRIIQSTVETTLQTHNRPGARQTTRTIFVPRVVYNYEVAGNTFEGDGVGGIPGSGTPDTATKYIARFPMNTNVTVFYNPKDPAQSTLKPDVGYLRVVLWVLSALFAGAAIAGINLIPGIPRL